ncbi:MAG: hypothetical protein JNM93_14185 [Bacteriovoracaceae bacterium]|nr:hypothetical protein [Bacteriovoracaceae bacterium]
MNGFPDNLSHDLKNNTLWVASHLKILALKKHSEGPKHVSPSQIEQYDLNQIPPKMIYKMTGASERLSGISVGEPKKDSILLGTIYRNEVVECGIK